MDGPNVISESARMRLARAVEAGEKRRAKAWRVAREAAALLKTRYHASRVVVFGSLPHAARFNQWSDVDLAAWGLSPENYFEAVARVLDLADDIRLDLIMAERCKPVLREAILQGVEV